MSNIIRSDIYRLKKGAAIKVTTLVSILLVLMIVLVSFTILTVTSNIPTENMTQAQLADMQEDIAEAQAQTTGTAANFISEINGQNFFIFLFLVAIFTIFSIDFDNGTYKNTLSYESNRNKVFWGKFILTFLTCMAIKLVTLVASVIISLIFMGTTGFTATFWLQTLLAFVLQMPIYIAILAVAFCIVVFTRKTATLYVTYIVGLTAISIAFQTISSMKENLSWLSLLDPLSAATSIARGSISGTPMLLSIGFFSIIAVIALVVGSLHFKKADLH